MSLFKNHSKELQEQISLLQSKVQSLESENTDLRSQIENAVDNTEEITSLNSQLATLRTEIETKDLEISDLQSQLAETQTEVVETAESTTDKALQIVSGLGIAPVEGLTEENSEEEKSILDQFKSLSGKDQIEFFAKNKREILKAVSTQH